MNNILSFDSVFIVNPLRKIYILIVKKILDRKESGRHQLILYRLDQENILIRDPSNISGMATGLHQHHIDAMSINFYKYLENSLDCSTLSIKNLELYKLYTRQVKLKLAGILKCAYRIKNLTTQDEKEIEIITDRQTISILKEAFLFLEYKPNNIVWKASGQLTACITINSFVMRLAAMIKMLISRSNLPKEYYLKYLDSDNPTVLISMPRRRPEDFFVTYVEELGDKFNIILYGHGPLEYVPKDYKILKVKRSLGVLRGLFHIKNLCRTAESYVADILLIFSGHANLNTSIDVVNSIYTNKIDILINRQQTNVIDNFLAIKAKNRGTFIIGDVFEEIFYCDSAICSSKSQHTESLNLALGDRGEVTYKGSSSLIKYRLKNFTNKQERYLHHLLEIEQHNKVIFYASDPVKEENQRYMTEKFLMSYFSGIKNLILVIKTHTQDDGKVTDYAFLDSASPSNIILIGDVRQKSKIVSDRFKIFDSFDFNAAVSSSDGFLTASSSSILQALFLGVKSGIVDKFNNGNYDYLINYKATMLVNNKASLKYFLDNKKLEISDDALSYCGLNDENTKFDLGKHLLTCLYEFQKTKKYDGVKSY
ncbi:hypothetical protein OAO31_05300 [Gammaproteobacteria bacterium]|nr:hypothetical protein [Gammaproteobacteria bacterium]